MSDQFRMNSKTRKKYLLNRLLISSPLFSAILRKTTNKIHHGKLLILNYHQVVKVNEFLPDWCCIDRVRFQEQMGYLKKHSEVVSLRDGIEKVNNGVKNNRPYVAITFDDGYQNNFDFAYPVLKKYHFPATIFLTTSLINTGRTLWSCNLNRAIFNATFPELTWNGEFYDLSTVQGKTRSFRQLQADLKKLPHPLLLDECNRIVKLLQGKDISDQEPTQMFKMLDDSSISEMLDSGLIHCGAHTRDHAILSKIKEEDQYTQICQSVDDVKNLTGEDSVLFAYPNGRKSDYNRLSLKILKDAGVSNAVTTIPGWNNAPLAQFELKRIGVGGNWGLGIFKFAVHTGLSSRL